MTTPADQRFRSPTASRVSGGTSFLAGPVVALLAGVTTVRAASDTWSGAVSGAWVTGSNWVGNQAPGNTTSGSTTTTDAATFSNTTNTAITIDSGRTIQNLFFNDGAGAFTFRGSQLFVTSGTISISGTSPTVATATVPSQTFYNPITGGTGGSVALRSVTFTKAPGGAFGSVYNLFGDVSTGAGGAGTVNFAGQSISMVRGVVANATTGTTAVATDFNGPIVWLRGANTYTGATTFSRGMYIFDSITGINGGASSFGNATAATGTFSGGSTGASTEMSFYYAGSASGGHSTDRAISMTNVSNVALVAAGVGPLTWNGNVVTGTTNQLVLSGPSAAENRFGGVLSSTTANVMSLWKRGEGTWNLTGANTYTGTTTITSGLLRLDFANSGAVNSNIVSSSSLLSIGGGRLNVRGADSESNSQAFGSTSFREGYAAISLSAGSGGSVALTLGALSRTIAGSGSNSGSTVDFTLGSSGTVFTTTNTTTNGVLAVGGVAMASVGKSDWATLSGSSIVAVSSYDTATNPASWSASSNVSLTASPSGSVTSGTINTLRLAGASTVTIASANTFSLGAGGILAAGSGGPMLITGGTIRGANGALQTERDLVVLQHNTTNPLTIASSIANAANGATSLTKGGDGMLELSGSNSFSGGITIGGGVLKISGASAMGSSGVKFAGGVLGLTADITGTVGAGGANRFQWQGSGGFAAYGGDRTITFASTLEFLSTGTANAQRYGELLLSAADADGTITLATTAGSVLNLGSVASLPYMATIRVFDGSESIDAHISAPITVSASVNGRGGFQKMGAGVLQLSGSNTYNGPTIVAEGGLLVTGTNFNAMVTEVRDGAWLGGSGVITSLELQAGGTVAPGLLSAIGTLATTGNAGNGYFLWNGSTTSAAQMAFQLSTLNDTSDLINLGTDNLIKGSGSTFKFDFLGSNGKVGETYTLLSFGTTTFTDVNDFSYENLGSNTGTFALENNALTFTVVPEPTTIALLGSAGVAACVGWLRRRRGTGG